MKIYKESKLNNGFHIITSEDNNSDIVSMSLRIKSGSRYEKEDERGYAHILEHMLLRGTKNISSPYELALITDRAGAFLNASTNLETIRVSIQTVKQKWEEMLRLMNDIVFNPLIDGKILENEKKVIIQEINKAFDKPSKLLWTETLKRIYENYPLSNYPLGTKESVISATPQKLKNYHERFLMPGRMALFVVGNIKHEEIVEIASNFIGNIENKNLEEEKIELNIKKGGDFIYLKGNQTYFNFSFVGKRVDFIQSLALDILSVFLAGSRTSLLNNELRQKEGLVYGISSSNTTYEDSNLFYVETSSSYPEKVIPIILEKVLNIEKYFTKNLFEDYKEQLINLLSRKLSDPFVEIGFLNNSWKLYGKLISPQEFYGLVRNLTYSDIILAKEKFITKDNLFIMQLGEKKTEVAF